VHLKVIDEEKVVLAEREDLVLDNKNAPAAKTEPDFKYIMYVEFLKGAVREGKSGQSGRKVLRKLDRSLESGF